LQDVNLRVEQGEWIGLVGASGEGKTTLIDCLCGLLVPQEGRIEIFGEALLGLHPHRRFSEMTLVPQDVTLIGNELSSILTWQHMLTPVASLDDIIDCLGLDQMFFEGGGEVIDEMGRDTSGGMKTRLGLGRALASAPRILILDETTARLDPRTEGEILGRIRAAFPLLTVLVSSHRKETLRHVDRVVLLAAGNLSEASSNGLGA
jgi:ABC-type transport system involved in cytochrome bd biosynthesis fused ATPase/permease subunit